MVKLYKTLKQVYNTLNHSKLFKAQVFILNDPYTCQHTICLLDYLISSTEIIIAQIKRSFLMDVMGLQGKWV